MTKLVCLSGGIDSYVALNLSSPTECECLLFDYGQAHKRELDYAVRICSNLNVPFRTVTLPSLGKTDYVVFGGRNLLFAATAIAIATARSFDSIVVGCNRSDWERFPDCRPEFWDNLNMLSRTAYNIGIETPLIYKTKTEVVQTAIDMKLDLNNTWSCYAPVGERECGICLACSTKAEAIRQCSR